MIVSKYWVLNDKAIYLQVSSHYTHCYSWTELQSLKVISAREVRNSSVAAFFFFFVESKALKHSKYYLLDTSLHILFYLNTHNVRNMQCMFQILGSLIIDSLLSTFISAMEELDGDEVRVSSRGRLAERDIVQVLIIFGLLTFKIQRYTMAPNS